MRSIATIDRPEGEDRIAVWITSRRGERTVAHGNAIVVDLAQDPHAAEQVHAITRQCALLLTDGTDLERVPLAGTALDLAALDDLVAETLAHQARILDAIDQYAVRPDPLTGKAPRTPRPILRPALPDAPHRAAFQPFADTPAQRALAVANYLARVWTMWLATDEARRSRCTGPQGESPWMMPDELSSPVIATFPPRFAARLDVQPPT